MLLQNDESFKERDKKEKLKEKEKFFFQIPTSTSEEPYSSLLHCQLVSKTFIMKISIVKLCALKRIPLAENKNMIKMLIYGCHFFLSFIHISAPVTVLHFTNALLFGQKYTNFALIIISVSNFLGPRRPKLFNLQLKYINC